MKHRRYFVASLFALWIPLVVGACSRKRTMPSAEALARERYAATMFEDIDAGRAWGVSSKADVQFDEGFSTVMFDPPNQDPRPAFYNHAFRWIGQHAHARLRVHEQKKMKITVGGWTNEFVLRTHPVVELFIDGFFLAASGVLGTNGLYYIEQEVPEWMLRREWVDLVIKTNSVAFHWADPPNLQSVLVYRLGWSEVGNASSR